MPSRRRIGSEVSREHSAGSAIARESAARLAGALALGLGSDFIVCLSCPLESLQDVVPLVTVTLSPLTRLPLPPGGTLLVVLNEERAGQSETRTAAARLAGEHVPEVWLWRGPDEWLERLRAPLAGLYRERALLHPGEDVVLLGRVVTLP